MKLVIRKNKTNLYTGWQLRTIAEFITLHIRILLPLEYPDIVEDQREYSGHQHYQKTGLKN